MTERAPTNRNFGGTINVRSNNRPKSISSRNSPIHIFIFTLIFLACGLLCSAIYLSRQLDLNHDDALSFDKQSNGRQQSNSAAEKIINNAAVDRKNRGSESSSSLNERVTEITPKKTDEYKKSVAQTDFSTTFKEYPHDRLYCMVPFIWNPSIYSAIMSTWGQRCDTIHFLTDAIVGGELNGDAISFGTTNAETGGEGGGGVAKPYWEYPLNTFPPNVKFINMTRSWEDCPAKVNRRTGRTEQKVCRHIWEKMWRSWVYVAEHHLSDAEWFCKVDYDTFFFPDNLKYYVNDVKGWDGTNEHHYFGHVIQHRNRKDKPMVVGASACWSQKTLRDIAQVYRDMPKGSTKGERGKCEDRAHATEEVTTSQCLRDHLHIEPEPARDDQLREYITIDKYPLVLSWNRTEQGEWWFWKGKPQDAGQMENTIARRPIGIHKYKQAEEILRLWQEFYGPKDNVNLQDVGRGKHGQRAKKFVEEVRKAMGIDP